MDDLRDRFASLDRVPVPDVWPDVERRLDAFGAAPPMRLVRAGSAPRPVAGVPSRRRILPAWPRPVWILVTVALIAALLVAGALSVGSGPFRKTSLLPSSPDASLITRPTSTSPSASTTEPNLTSGSWIVTGTTTQVRDFATVAGLLSDGRVLVVGGHGAGGGGGGTDPAMRSADLYDPASGHWTETGPTQSPHWGGHTVTPLPDGTVLVAGGFPLEPVNANPGPTSAAELFDPGSGHWTQTGSMTVPRTRQVATLLQDGSVLVVGGYVTSAGYVTGTGSTRKAEIFDPRTGTWARTASMTVVRVARFATTLPDGRVLVIGNGGPADASFDAVEVYDPSSRIWIGGPTTGRGDCGVPVQIVLLTDGSLLGLCGTVFQPDSVASSAFLFDLATATWTPTGAPIRRLSRTATLLADGRVLASDVGSGELYDPTTGKWTSAGLPSYPASRSSGFPIHGGDNTFWYEIDTATLLHDGRVLLTIGPGALLFDPAGAP
jgi:hypothetical protein